MDANLVLQNVVADAARCWHFIQQDVEVLLGRPNAKFTPTVEGVRAKARGLQELIESVFPVLNQEGERVYVEKTLKDGSTRRYPETDWAEVAATTVTSSGYTNRLPTLSDLWLIRSVLDHLEKETTKTTAKKAGTKRAANNTETKSAAKS